MQEQLEDVYERLKSDTFIKTPVSETTVKIVYSEQEKILEVELSSGKVYQYLPALLEDWEEYKNLIERGESSGIYYNKIVKTKFKYYRQVVLKGQSSTTNNN